MGLTWSVVASVVINTHTELETETTQHAHCLYRNMHTLFPGARQVKVGQDAASH